MQANLKLQSLSTLDAIGSLVQCLLCLKTTSKDKLVASSLKGIASEEVSSTLQISYFFSLLKFTLMDFAYLYENLVQCVFLCMFVICRAYPS